MIGKRITGTGDASTGPSVLRGLYIWPADAGTPRLTLRDNNATGEIRFDCSPSTAHGANAQLFFPGTGITFKNGIHVSDMTAITGLTLLIGPDGTP